MTATAVREAPDRVELGTDGVRTAPTGRWGAFGAGIVVSLAVAGVLAAGGTGLDARDTLVLLALAVLVTGAVVAATRLERAWARLDAGDRGWMYVDLGYPGSDQLVEWLPAEPDTVPSELGAPDRGSRAVPARSAA